MQNQVFEMTTADSMVMEWNIYMHVIDFSFTNYNARSTLWQSQVLATIAQNTTAAALDSTHFSKKGIMDFIHCLCEFLACKECNRMTLNSNYILLNVFIIVTKFWVILYSCYCFISLVAQIFGREQLLESQETNEDTVSRGNNFVLHIEMS